MQPTPEKIKQLKELYADRVLMSVDAIDGDEQVMTFVMTGPTRDEYEFFIEKMIAAREVKGDADRIKAVRSAVENAALAQIRWPDRDTVKKAFDSRPEMIDGFSTELQKAAGSNVELRSKKL